MRYVDCSANDGTVESSLESQCCVYSWRWYPETGISSPLALLGSQPRNEPKLSSSQIEASICVCVCLTFPSAYQNFSEN